MAVDQTKPATSADAAKPQAAHAEAAEKPGANAKPQAAEKPGAAPELDDTKRKFREALDRKRGAQAAGNADGAQDTGKVHGSHGPAASKRSFRRKSGS